MDARWRSPRNGCGRRPRWSRRSLGAQKSDGCCAAFRSWIVVDEMAARNVVEHETLALQKPDDFARPNGGEFRHTRGLERQPTIHRPLEWVPRVSSDSRYSRKWRP